MVRKYVLKFKLPSGYIVKFEQGKITNTVIPAIVVMGYIFKGNKKLASIPGVVVHKDLSDPLTIRSVYLNHVQSLQDAVDLDLKISDYDVEEFLKDHPHHAYDYAMNLIGAQ